MIDAPNDPDELESIREAKVREILAAARATAAKARSREHDHRGPDPCPVCGGGPDRTAHP